LIETLPRKGYRFIGKIDRDILVTTEEQVSPVTVSAARTDEFSLPSRLARRLFLLVQVGYLASVSPRSFTYRVWNGSWAMLTSFLSG